MILLDSELRTISRFYVLASLKRDARMLHTPIMMVTSHAAEQNAMRAHCLGATCLICKCTERAAFCEQVGESLLLVAR